MPVFMGLVFYKRPVTQAGSDKGSLLAEGHVFIYTAKGSKSFSSNLGMKRYKIIQRMILKHFLIVL